MCKNSTVKKIPYPKLFKNKSYPKLYMKLNHHASLIH